MQRTHEVLDMDQSKTYIKVNIKEQLLQLTAEHHLYTTSTFDYISKISMFDNASVLINGF